VVKGNLYKKRILLIYESPTGINKIARGKTPGTGFNFKIKAPTGRNKTNDDLIEPHFLLRNGTFTMKYVSDKICYL